MTKNFYNQEVDAVLNFLDTEVTGLDESQALERIEKYGLNEIKSKNKSNPFATYIKQFKSALIYILFIAAIISFLFDKTVDVYVILFVIFANSLIGFIQEYRAEKSIEALKKIIVSTAKVFRDGEVEEIFAYNIVPGDIVLLEEGDKIPADLRIMESKNLKTQESSLTGESYPVNKNNLIIEDDVPIADQSNMLFTGTFVVSGEAKAVAVVTGDNTVLGQIAEDIGSIKKRKWHFEEKTDQLAKQLAFLAFGGASVIFFVGYFLRGFSFEDIFLFTIASLVSAIPEGLPAVIAIVLAVGAYRMAQRKAIIRKLPATETLSVVDTIITDKTGTLTQNTITVEKVFLPGEDIITVSGTGWEPKGNFHQSGESIIPLENNHLSKLLHISALCNNAHLIKKENSNSNTCAEDFSITGDPTEAALLVLAEKAGIKKEIVDEMEKQIDDLPFSSDRKYRASLHRKSEEKKSEEIYVIGAPEVIIEKSSSFLEKNKIINFTSPEKKKVHGLIDGVAQEGFRTVAVAYRGILHEDENVEEKDVKDLTFVGFLAMRDPLRPGIKESVLSARDAGINIIMATGDHKKTALSIAKEAGIVAEGKIVENDIAIEGKDISKMSDKDLLVKLKSAKVFARLSPKDKLRIATLLQSKGHFIAMTGDGVNDAAALTKADIGISMGIIGTDVARESSEMVLADDNFTSIVGAIEEGRNVFNNTRRVSSHLVTTSMAEQTTLVSTMLIGLPLPLIPIQILFLNLVTDTFIGAALAAEPSHPGVLKKPPRSINEWLISKEVIPFVVMIIGLMATSTIFVFNLYVDKDINKARTMAFMVMSLTQLFNAFNMRSANRSVFHIGFFKNKYILWGLLTSLSLTFLIIYLPFTSKIFNFVPPNIFEIILVVLLSSLVLIFGELYKAIRFSIVNKSK
jgi:Ca2+-transporting ATPase